MSIFATIMHKIFGAAEAAMTPIAGKTAGAAPGATPDTTLQAKPDSTPVAMPGDPAASPATAATPLPPSTAPAATPAPVDAQAVLTQMAAQKGGGGNWQTSIVDLLKLLDLDSSLDARKQLAGELNVHAGADGTAEQNMALSKAVMEKLAASGGKMPAGLA